MASALPTGDPIYIRTTLRLLVLRANCFIHFTFQCGESAYLVTQSAFVPPRVRPALFRYHAINHTVPTLPHTFLQYTKDCVQSPE